MDLNEHLYIGGETFLLTSVICHRSYYNYAYGSNTDNQRRQSIDSGHYYTLHRIDGEQWVCLDDKKVTMTNDDEDDSINLRRTLFLLLKHNSYVILYRNITE